MTEATQRRQLILQRGIVAAKSGDKTIRVHLEFQMQHPKYGKYLRRRTTAHVHDEQNQAKVGDTVDIAKCRPMSKTKCWRLVRVISSQDVVQIGQ